jgi:hypothetical protein
MSSYEQQNAKSKQLKLSVRLQSMIEDERKGIEAPWLGTLPFCVDLYGDGNYLNHDNIFDLMKGTALSGHIVRFSPMNYPPGTKEESLRSLVRDKSLVCSCSKIANKKKESKENDGPPNYHPETLHHDRKNNRPHGNQNCSRCCTTKWQLSSNKPMCTFRLNIYHDSESFFLKIGSGSVFHCHHTILDENAIRLPSRYVSPDEAKLMGDERQASLSANTARNLFYIRSSGDLLSKSQVSTITGKNSCSTKNSSNDIKHILQECFQKEKAECCFLYHQTGVNKLHTASTNILHQEGGINEYHNITNGAPSIKPALCPDTAEAVEMSEYAPMNQRAQGLVDSQDILLAVAWVLPAEKHLFHLFPYVVHIDGIEDTNNEKWPLFTLTGRDSMGNMFTILRAFLPNQCAWVFRWLFQNVLPCFFGLNLLNHIEIILTDGDSQETSQLDFAIKRFFCKGSSISMYMAYCQQRDDEVFSQGTCQKYVNRELYDKWDHVRSTISNWMWSWSDD